MNRNKPLTGLSGSACWDALFSLRRCLIFVGTILLFLLTETVCLGATAPAFVQEKDHQANSGNKSSVAFSKSTAAGNLIVAYLIWDKTGSASVSDSLGNTYVGASGATRWNNGSYSAQIFYAINVRGGSDTVTATFSTAVKSFGLIYAHEYSGIDQTTPLDVTAFAAGTGNSMNSGTVATTSASDLLFGGGVSGYVITAPGAGYVPRSTFQGNMTLDRIVSVTGSYAATASNSAGATWGLQLAAFRGAGSGTTVTSPAITAQPSNQTVTAGQPATFSVVASGSAPLSYQWQRNGTPISGANSASYTTPPTTTADSGSSFLVAVSNSAGSVSSSAAILTVNPAPVTLQSIAVSPVNPSVNPTQTQQFTATGTYSDGSSKNITASVTWKSSSSAVATISATTGLATGVSAGNTQITATLGSVVSPNDTLTVNPIALQSIAVSPANPSVNPAQNQQFTATGSYNDGSSKNITANVIWTSSNPTVATIGATTGLATGVSAGTTQITAMLGSVVSPSDALTVNAVTLQLIAVSPSNPNINPEQTQQFTATGTYSDGGSKNITTNVFWASSNPAVASIGGSTGLATGASAGTTQITATLGAVASPGATLTVNAIVLQSISVTPASPSINPSQTQQFAAMGTYSDGSSKDVTTSAVWASSNHSVATVGPAPGLVTGNSAGTAQITAAVGSVASPAATLTVNAIALQSIAVSPLNPSISPNQTQQFTATGTYSDGSSKDITTSVTWTSSSAFVATIGANSGIATGVGGGTSQITATLGNIVSPADTLTVASATGNSYSTTFSQTENPIAESGRWISGKSTGLDWADVRTTPGLAFGTESGNILYDDSTAVLTGNWGPDQTAQATVHTVNQNSNLFEEVELRLRTSITPHSITGYEINFRCTTDGSQYVQIVRWNGRLGDFTGFASAVGPGLRDGDVVTVTAIGNTFSAYINGKLITQGTDSRFTNGSPGVGFYMAGGNTSQNGDFGFSSFSASDGGTADATPPSVPVNVVANVISASEVDLSWNASTDNVAVAGYRVYRNNTLVASTTGTSFADKTVVPGILYAYSVAAFDAAGNVSAQSSAATAQTEALLDETPPTTPSNLQSSNVTGTSLTLTWSASTDNIGVAGYQVFRNGVQAGTTTATTFTDTKLAPSTSYTYTVAAYDGSGNVSAQSQSLSVTTGTAALTPPTFVQVNNNQIGNGSTVSVKFSAATHPGNTIVVYVIWNNTGSVLLSDSSGNTFVNAGAPVNWGNGSSAQVFYATGIVGGSDTVTATFRTPVTSYGVLYVHEYAGIDPVNPIDVTVSASGSSSTLNSGSATTTSANDLIFGAGVSDNTVTGAGSGFLWRDLAYGNITEDRIATSVGSYFATAPHVGNKWGMQMVAFRAAQ